MAFKLPDKPPASPLDGKFTLEELAQFNGSDASKPIYVAIKGTVFDVSSKPEMYGPGKSYNVFAGKDGSRGLGKSSTKPEDAIADTTGMTASELKVLDDWFAFFEKRYQIVGHVVNGPKL
ncbi:progesterone binding protein [Planoprotostelium fungivorum]|uniref:Progesterone binding protein n=1 Tax=Planoprotostelium fungivorum TaxID=1890364 RepID=A0A2P6MP09_9EUKA|nr:progesterone binding protein [Planoprotostelium fungivorum]